MERVLTWWPGGPRFKSPLGQPIFYIAWNLPLPSFIFLVWRYGFYTWDTRCPLHLLGVWVPAIMVDLKWKKKSQSHLQFGLYKDVEWPGPASSEEEHLLHKIVFSGDLSSNPSSSKKTPWLFCAQIFALKCDLDSSKYVTGIGIGWSAIYWRRTFSKWKG